MTFHTLSLVVFGALFILMTGSKNLLNVRSGNGRGFYYAKRICASLPLDYSRDTHNLINFSTQHYTIIQLFIHHTHLFFPFRICTCQTSHIIVCIEYTLPICIFVYCSFVVCVLSLSFCWTVELWSLKQIPPMCKHTWP